MHEDVVNRYRCPYTGDALTLRAEIRSGGDIRTGELVTASGRKYRIEDGIPFLVDASEERLSPEEKREADYYEASASTYDAVISWLFKSFYEDEDRVRDGLVSLLELKPNDKVLETGCGTCRDSMRIAAKLDGGDLFLQDYSPSMLRLGVERMRSVARPGQCKLEYFVGNASQLPFPDGFFDAAFHFGGLNLFSDKRKALLEMARVVRTGGKVVVGDESMAPWLRDTEYGKILLNSNQLYSYAAPIELVPDCAREVCLRWILGNAFFVIDFRVGDGPPPVDLDLPILGARGGTHRTRYYGKMEGVRMETRAMAISAAHRRGLSVHDWLDQAVAEAAGRDLLDA